MTTSRLAILLAVLLGGLSTVFLLPKQIRLQPLGIELELPKMVGGVWYGRDQEVSDREREVLGHDTDFSRKVYTNARGDSILTSIVLSGQDMNTSIHRPEWCLPAQGWTIAGSNKASVPLRNRGTLTTTRLFNIRVPHDRDTGKPIVTPEGQQFVVRNLDYYWFVGYDGVTASHLNRNLTDVTDRLTHGYNQRWAFVTVAAEVTDNLRRDGLTEAATDEMLRDFIQKLAPLIHKDTVRFH
jgi:EpsI family protein